MIIQYFTKKENIEKSSAIKIYKDILKISNNFLNKNDFFFEKNYNTSFEIVSIFLIIIIKKNIHIKLKNYKKINDYLVSTFISDLDESLRTKGIGDMSIGKYVKSYVKKFYFRLKAFPDFDDIENKLLFFEYLKIVNFINEKNISEATKQFLDISSNINIQGK